MTPAQQKTVSEREAKGFRVIGTDRDGVIRMTNGADQRVVFKDGTEKRAQHDYLRW